MTFFFDADYSIQQRQSYIQVKQICQKIDGTIQPVIVESSAGAAFFHDRNETLIQGVLSEQNVLNI